MNIFMYICMYCMYVSNLMVSLCMKNVCMHLCMYKTLIFIAYVVCMCVLSSVIMGNSSNPIRGLVFDSVVVENPGSKPWGDNYYYCQNDGGVQVPCYVLRMYVCIDVCMYVCMFV